MKKKTNFSLGTLNSELQEQEIQIPDGYEASIEGGKIIFRKKESEDERIRKIIVGFFKGYKEEGTCGSETFNGIPTDNILAWLEKQSKCNPYSGASFEYNNHTWGMCARDNGVEIILDGELKAFLSLENSFIYPIHPQPSIKSIPTQNITSEAKEAKVEPKFHEGDWIVFNGLTLFIEEVVQGYYRTTSIGDIHNSYDWSIDNAARLWTIQDAKDGDILTCYNTKKGKPFKQTGKLKQYIGKHGGCSNCFLAQIGIDWNGNIKTNMYMGSTEIFPATKTQREYLFTEVKVGISLKHGK